jgi:ABC-type multidrug transport system ATPase subunit
MPAIETEGLTKDYNVGFWRPKPYRALDHLTMAVELGEVFGFLGPNGAGKSTTLKLLMGLIFPTSGSARILGKPVGDLDARRKMGFLPENPSFYDYLSAEELLTYFASRTAHLLCQPAWTDRRRGQASRVGLARPGRSGRRAADEAALVFEGHDPARWRGASPPERA